MKTNRNGRIVILAVLAALAFPASLSAAKPGIRAGKWEVTGKMEIPGVDIPMPPITTTQCVTEEDAVDPRKTLPKSAGSGDCKVTDYKLTGNKATWSVECTGSEMTKATGEMTFKGDTYEAWMKMDVKIGADQEEMVMRYTGRRLGDCGK